MMPQWYRSSIASLYCNLSALKFYREDWTMAQPGNYLILAWADIVLRPLSFTAQSETISHSWHPSILKVWKSNIGPLARNEYSNTLVSDIFFLINSIRSVAISGP